MKKSKKENKQDVFNFNNTLNRKKKKRITEKYKIKKKKLNLYKKTKN